METILNSGFLGGLLSIVFVAVVDYCFGKDTQKEL